MSIHPETRLGMPFFLTDTSAHLVCFFHLPLKLSGLTFSSRIRLFEIDFPPSSSTSSPSSLPPTTPHLTSQGPAFSCFLLIAISMSGTKRLAEDMSSSDDDCVFLFEKQVTAGVNQELQTPAVNPNPQGKLASAQTLTLIIHLQSSNQTHSRT